MRKKEFMIGPVLILTAILTGYLLTGLFNAQLGEAKRIQEQELQEHLAKEVLQVSYIGKQRQCQRPGTKSAGEGRGPGLDGTDDSGKAFRERRLENGCAPIHRKLRNSAS